MNDWLDSYGVNTMPNMTDLMNQRAAEQAQRNAFMQQAVERERQMAALNSPFVQQMIQGMNAQPSPNSRPSFSPGMPGALTAADQISPRYPSAMGVDLPHGSRSGGISSGGGSSPNSQSRVGPGGNGDVSLDIVMGEIERDPRRDPPPGSTKDSAGRPIINVSGANWVNDKPKQSERQLLGGRVDPRQLPRQPAPQRGAPAPEQMTPEQFAIFQQLSPQLTQRRVAQEQSTSAEDRKYAELDMKNQNSQMRQGYDIWKTSVETATKLRLAEQKLRAKASQTGAPRMLRDLVPAMANIRGQLEGESNRLAVMLQNGYGASQNPAEQQAVRAAQVRIGELMQSADAVTMQYTGLFNQSYDTTVPTLRPTSPIPQAPGGQGRQPSGPAPGRLSPSAEQFLRKHG